MKFRFAVDLAPLVACYDPDTGSVPLDRYAQALQEQASAISRRIGTLAAALAAGQQLATGTAHAWRFDDPAGDGTLRADLIDASGETTGRATGRASGRAAMYLLLDTVDLAKLSLLVTVHAWTARSVADLLCDGAAGHGHDANWQVAQDVGTAVLPTVWSHLVSEQGGGRRRELLSALDVAVRAGRPQPGLEHNAYQVSRGWDPDRLGYRLEDGSTVRIAERIATGWTDVAGLLEQHTRAALLGRAHSPL